MASWRDAASQRAQEDLDRLLGAVLPFALQSLERHGAFYPYGATVSTDGEVSLAAVDVDADNQPSSETLLTELQHAVRARKELVRAAAFVADVSLEDGDAIRVVIEHADGVTLTVLQPYTRSGLSGRVITGQMQLAPGTSHTWA